MNELIEFFNWSFRKDIGQIVDTYKTLEAVLMMSASVRTNGMRNSAIKRLRNSLNRQMTNLHKKLIGYGENYMTQEQYKCVHSKTQRRLIVNKMLEKHDVFIGQIMEA